MTLKDQTAVVTGGGTGIGRAIAEMLGELGANVVIAGRRQEVLDKVAADWKHSSKCVPHATDVADRSSLESLFRKADELGPLGILVSAAGINIRNRSMALTSPEDWERVLAVNASGAFYAMQFALERMRPQKSGTIVNISSVAGKRALEIGGIAYCASKFAMTAAGTAASNEESDNGIRITNIYPGEVNTPILENRPVPVSDEHKAKILQPEDLAAAVKMVLLLPPTAHVPELVIKPLSQHWM